MEPKRSGMANPIRPSGRFPAGTLDPAQKTASRDEVVSLLGEFAPLDPSFGAALEIPERLYMIGSRASPVSFTANPSGDPGAVARWLLAGFAKPAQFPDFGIHIGTHGSSLFCTLIDKFKKVIVVEAIGGDYAGKGSWKAFESSFRAALSKAEELGKQGAGFDFVVVKDGVTEVI